MNFPLMNALVYVNIDQGIYKVKLKVALNEKQKKLRGVSFSINMANFEAFRQTKKMISNLFFLKSVYLGICINVMIIIRDIFEIVKIKYTGHLGKFGP